MKILVIWCIRFYQKRISKLKKKPTCRFHPTCSQYFLEAVQYFGVWKGIKLGRERISRCKGNGEYGFDPVEQHIRVNQIPFVEELESDSR